MNIDSSRLARFLLGQLSEEENRAIADEIVANERFAEAVEDAERDLIDAYARGDLNETDCVALEQQVLTSDEQFEKLRFARALAGRKHEIPDVPHALLIPDRAPSRWHWLVMPGLAAVALAAILVSGVLFQRERRLNAEVAELRRTLAERGRIESGANGASAIVAFLLSPNQRSAGVAKLRIPLDAALVRLNFEVPSPERAWRVTVATAGGDVMFTERSLASQGAGELNHVAVLVSAASFPEGTFEATLTAEGSADSIHYSFAASRK
jgi:hypothetical protein